MQEAPNTSLEQARAVLRRQWRYPDFRPGQDEVVASVLAGRDVLAILPTGGGKSICYQVPAVLGEGLTLVVSPLVALMQDQVAGLKAHGISAAFINSTLTARAIDQCWTDAEFGRYRLLYIAPERLQSDVFLARAERLKVTLLAVDEAHCVSEWGHHFRPSYLQIAQARAALGDPPTIAVTATATPEVRRDVVEHLSLRDPDVIVKGFDRPNLVWSIFRGENKREKVLDVLRGVSGSGILYATTRREVETWADWLAQQGESVVAYHAGLPAEVRTEAQRAWVEGRVRLVVATNAFGMGIDKPDVRFVIHVSLPASLEAYYQEAGRAGRDGRKAYAVLLFTPSDESTQHILIEGSHPSARSVAEVYDAVCNLGQIPHGDLPEAPVGVNVDAVVQLTGQAAGRVRAAIDLLVRQETWQSVQPRRHQGLIRFLQPADAVRRYAEGLHNESLARFVTALLRIVHADAFSGWWEIDLRLLERRTKLSRERLARGMAFLEEHGLILWRPPEQALRVQFNEARAVRLAVDDLAVQRARRRAETRLRDMLRYARSVTCRRHFLLAYFGEQSAEDCGQCDVCLGRHRTLVITPADEPVMRHILHQIEKDVPRSAWFEAPPAAPHHIDGLVDWLVQEGFVRVEEPLEETFSITEKAATLMQQWKPRA